MPKTQDSKYLIRSDKAINSVHEPPSWSDPNRVALYVILFKIVSVSVTSVRQAIGFRPKSSAIVDRIQTNCLYCNSLRKFPYANRGEVLLAVSFVINGKYLFSGAFFCLASHGQRSLRRVLILWDISIFAWPMCPVPIRGNVGGQYYFSYEIRAELI